MKKGRGFTTQKIMTMWKDAEICYVDRDHVFLSNASLMVRIPRIMVPRQLSVADRSYRGDFCGVLKEGLKRIKSVWKNAKQGHELEEVIFGTSQAFVKTKHNGNARLYKTENGPLMIADRLMTFVENYPFPIRWVLSSTNKDMVVAMAPGDKPIGIVMVMRICDDGESLGEFEKIAEEFKKQGADKCSTS